MRSKAIDARPAWKASGLRSVLRNARLAAGLTQADVANEAGYTQPQLAGWERGLVAPHFSQLADWCEALGLKLYIGRITKSKPTGAEYRARMKALAEQTNNSH